jgi:sortase B
MKNEKIQLLVILTTVLVVLIVITGIVISYRAKSSDGILKGSDDAVRVDESGNRILSDEIEVSPIANQYYKQNSDTIGYIKIENTKIDYPVVYSGDNTYYMDRNFEKKKSKAGAIFLDHRCDYQDFSKTRNVILYGHRMRNGQMFKHVTKYLKEDFFVDNRRITFNTLDGEYEWEVFSVFITDVEFYYIDTEFEFDEKWLWFLNQCKDYSKFETDTTLEADDVILTLSTCVVNDNERLVLMAKLIK